MIFISICFDPGHVAPIFLSRGFRDLHVWLSCMYSEVVVYSEYKTGNTVNQMKMAVRTSLILELTNLVYNTKYGKQVS